jgi:hypothetical protein
VSLETTPPFLSKIAVIALEKLKKKLINYLLYLWEMMLSQEETLL